jgi:hypothetical protein
MAEVGCLGRVGRLGIGVVDAYEAAGVQESAQLLVQGDPAGQFGAFGLGCAGEVPFEAEVAEERRAGAEGQVVGRPAVWERAAPMCEPMSSRGRRSRVQRLIDWRSRASSQSLAQTWSVRSGDGEVDASASAGAGFDLQPGGACAQFVEQGVDGEGLGVHGGLTAR